MLESIAVERYEAMLLGQRRLSLNGSIQEKEKAACDIIHYAVAELLGWSKEEAEEHLTMKIIRKLKIDKVYKYIRFPNDVDPTKDVDYIAYLAYPDTPYNYRKQVLRVYRRILNGLDERFPSKIFNGQNGKEKGAILLSEFINNSLIVTSMEDLYEQFADMSLMNNKFRMAKIYSAAKKMYPTPLDYLHYSLPEGERDDFLYAFWQYKSVFKMHEAEMKREEKGKKKAETAEE